MQPLSLYLFRHGETDLNARNVVQGGGIDADLNDAGRTQAEKFFAQYEKTPFVGYYCSGLRRTYQTLEPFARRGASITALPDLNELGWGEMEGAPVRSVAYDALRIANLNWDAGNFDFAPPGGETPNLAWKRANRALHNIASAYPGGGKVLICTHGRLLRVILSNLLGYGLQNMQLFRHANTGLNVIVSPSLPFAYAERLNDLRHLNPTQPFPTGV